MTELHWLTIAEAGDLFRAKKLSPVGYTQALLDRTAAVNPKLDAFIKVTGDIARAEAKEAEADLAAGRDRGPMHGIPYGLKDIIDKAGMPTTAHSRVMDGHVADEDATVTARLRAAGAVLMGKLSTHEFALGGPIFDLPFPPARNPWNTAYHPGGSSSGSGSAVAGGLMPAAIGTDTGGSTRNPGSANAIVGMKPTYGRVSRKGVLALSFSLDHVGPLTRTVRDNAILLGAMAGYDPGDPGSADEPVPDFTAGIAGGVKGMKIGVIRHFYNRDMIAREDMGAAIEAAIAQLEKLGATIVELTVPPLSEFVAVTRTIQGPEAYAVHEARLQEKPETYGAFTRERLMGGGMIRAVDYVQALRHRGILQAKMNAALSGVDALITASAMEPSCRIDDWPEVSRTYQRHARQAFNVTGHPGITLPTGFSADGLPLSMQVIGKAFDEATMLRVAYAYEQSTDWHTRHPNL